MKEQEARTKAAQILRAMRGQPSCRHMTDDEAEVILDIIVAVLTDK